MTRDYVDGYEQEPAHPATEDRSSVGPSCAVCGKRGGDVTCPLAECEWCARTLDVCERCGADLEAMTRVLGFTTEQLVLRDRAASAQDAWLHDCSGFPDGLRSCLAFVRDHGLYIDAGARTARVYSSRPIPMSGEEEVETMGIGSSRDGDVVACIVAAVRLARVGVVLRGAPTYVGDLARALMRELPAGARFAVERVGEAGTPWRVSAQLGRYRAEVVASEYVRRGHFQMGRWFECRVTDGASFTRDPSATFDCDHNAAATFVADNVKEG